MFKSQIQYFNRKLGGMLSAPLSVAIIKKINSGYVSSKGLKFTLGSPLMNDSIVSSIFWGYYERTERKTIEKFLKKGLPIVELGSSIGYVTLNLFRISPDAKIVSVEGNQNLMPILEENVRLNQAGNVKLINAVISYSKEKKVAFTIDEGNLGSQLGVLTGGRLSNSVLVDSLSMKEILASESITGPYVLVCDIEGAEYFLFKNEQDEKVKMNCAQIIIELHDLLADGASIKKEEIAELIQKEWKLKPVFRKKNVWVFEKAIA
jgi:FkbM family methyltransferase